MSVTRALEHKLTIRREDDRYIVEVLPSPDGIGHDRELATHRDAYGYAAGLRMCMGWSLIDLTGEGNRG